MYRFHVDEAGGAVYQRFSRSLPVECWLFLENTEDDPVDRIVILGTVSLPPRILSAHNQGMRDSFIVKLTDAANAMLARSFVDVRLSPYPSLVDPDKDGRTQMDDLARDFVARANKSLEEDGV